MFSQNLHVSICTKALSLWRENKGISSIVSGKRRVDCMAYHVEHDAIMGVAYREACELSS